jgi:hypothetical protein
MPRLKKEYIYTSTPRLGLRGLFEGELYFTSLELYLKHTKQLLCEVVFLHCK